jgi:hypothetical protein
LLWLGHADPAETIEGSRELDPRLDALGAVIAQWQAVIEGATVSARDVIEYATAPLKNHGGRSVVQSRQEFAHPDFREALLTVAGEGGVINGKRLGKWLARHQEQIVSGYRFVRAGLSAGIMRWRLEAVQPERSESS